MGKTEEVLDRLECFQRLRDSRIAVNLPINFVDEIAELLKEQNERIKTVQDIILDELTNASWRNDTEAWKVLDRIDKELD